MTHVVTPVSREAMVKHSSNTPGLFALVRMERVVAIASNMLIMIRVVVAVEVVQR